MTYVRNFNIQYTNVVREIVADLIVVVFVFNRKSVHIFYLLFFALLFEL